MDWFESLDQYCERLDPSFWAEPLNALSNGAFIVAGLLLLAQWRNSPFPSRTSLLLIINILVIGVGSFLFHSIANRWSELADVLPITIFIHAYLLLALRHFLGAPWWLAIVATGTFLAVSPFAGAALEPVAGSSAFYGPALLAIFAVGAAAYRTDPRTAKYLCLAGTIFAVSIIFRAADQPFCSALPLGTHMMWHIVNGLVLYMLVRLLMKKLQ